jgi:hypothetical protein
VRTSSIPFSAGGVVWALVFILIGFRLGPLTRQALERSRPLTGVDQLVATRLVFPREAAVSSQGLAAVGLDWARIHSTNYPTCLRNLREVGCPPRTIHNILLADINASFDIRKALRPSDPGYLAPEALERERQQITTALLAEIGWKEESVSAGGLLSASSGILSAVTSAATVCAGAGPGAGLWKTPASNVPAPVRGASGAANAGFACASASGSSAGASASAAASGGGIDFAGSPVAISAAGSGPGFSTGATEASACRADAVSAGTCARGS